ncbi:TonB-dependent receptor domain-containing protein [Alteraurantiacibacter aquimixticola]|uniref:TonB-dependent receptor n=1 Tax=Alteraurantiacibacter aquimixticola TaxID=2489173 RepID=A0A4T3F0P2_9SPHN|nr:TonB-dependent receptor [Alteraurantiacibacter aquimixticola]TIX50504.1 TonB-dependent receptor [Alteraurantiacibacter aquimixticola]
MSLGNNRARRPVRFSRNLLACGASAMALVLGAGSVQAQDAVEISDDEDDRIVITGSRLAIPSGMESATPVTSIDEAEIDNLDPGTLIQAMNTLPIFINNDTPNSNAGFFARSGTGNLNLRGLGVNRTLTLLNGRRVAPTTAFGGADVNLIPSAMLRGVENVTGGASAAYGTDAVAGVTNFLLDTNFTGLEVQLQGGITERGDGENYEASLAYGTKIGSRGHFLVAGEVNGMEPIFNYEGRDWYQAFGPIDTDGDGLFEAVADVRSSRVSFDGIISAPGFSLNGYQFDPSGGYAPYQLGSVSNGAVGGFDARTSGGSGDDIGCGEVCNVWPDTDRYSIFAYADYELTDNVTVFAQYMRGYSHLYENATPRGSFVGFPTTLTIFQSNAFLPDEVRQAMVDEGIASFSLRRMCSVEDCGNLYYEEWSTQNIGTAGFEAEIDNGGGWFDGWQVDGYYQYAHSKKKWDQFGLRVDRIHAAIDAVDEGEFNGGAPNGNIICRVTAAGSTDFPGCTPINLFGRGNASAAAVDYVTGMDPGQQITTPLFFADTGFDLGITDSYTSTPGKRAITTFEQHFAELSFAGNVFDLPAGPLAVAFGGSYRKDSIYQVNRDPANPASDHEDGHPVLCSGESPGLRGVPGNECANTVATQYSKVSNIQGGADVKELFAETLIPVFDTKRGQQMGINLAARWADYEGSGEIWSYKGSVDLSLFDGLRLRGTYSRDVRAANLNERFNKTGGLGNVVDPRITDADIDACEAANPAPTSVNCTNTYQVTTFSGGNPNVNPEEADTFTAGFVFQPEFLPGFQLSLDWFKVSIDGAIGQVGLAEVARRCYEDADPIFCGLITESPSDTTPAGGYPLIVLAGDQYVNVEQSNVEGVDLEIGYNTDINIFGGGEERLSIRGFATWLLERSNTGAATAGNDFDPTVTRFDGFGSFPKFRATGLVNYTNGPLNVNFSGRVIGSSQVNNLDITPLPTYPLADNEIPAVFYMDARFNYDFELAGSDAQVYLSVNNLFDKDPPVIPGYGFFTAAATQTNTALHDVLGRRYTLGVRLKW